MRSILKKYKKVLEEFDDLLYDDYKSLDDDGILDAMEGRFSRRKIEDELARAESDRLFLLEVMEQNSKLIELLEPPEDDDE